LYVGGNSISEAGKTALRSAARPGSPTVCV
jgi:hypothetical protein